MGIPRNKVHPTLKWERISKGGRNNMIAGFWLATAIALMVIGGCLWKATDAYKGYGAPPSHDVSVALWILGWIAAFLSVIVMEKGC
jgi:hypothetical protein